MCPFLTLPMLEQQDRLLDTVDCLPRTHACTICLQQVPAAGVWGWGFRGAWSLKKQQAIILVGPRSLGELPEVRSTGFSLEFQSCYLGRVSGSLSCDFLDRETT